MSTCMLCSATVGPHDVVCPHCGGAVDDTAVTTVTPLPDDSVWMSPPPPPGPAPVPPGWGFAPPQASPGSPGPFDPSTAAYGADPHGPGPYGDGYGSGPAGSVPHAPGPYAPGPYGAPPAYGPPPYGAAPYGAVPYGAAVYVPPYYKVPTEGLAIGAFVTSLAGLILAFGCYLPILACPVGAVLGHVALRRIAEKGTQGRGLALAGTIIGWTGTGFLLLAVVLLVAVGVGGGLD